MRLRLTLVRPTAAGLARLFTALTGKEATEAEMQTLLEREGAPNEDAENETGH